MGPIYLGSNDSHIYPNMCAIFGCGPTVVSREKGGTYRHTDSWHEWVQDNFYGRSATKRIVIKEPSLILLWEIITFTLTDDNSQTQSVSLSNILWKLYITLGAIQVLRNADGVGGGCPFFRYEGVRFNVISVTRGWVGVQIPGKKRYVTLEWGSY